MTNIQFEHHTPYLNVESQNFVDLFNLDLKEPTKVIKLFATSTDKYGSMEKWRIDFKQFYGMINVIIITPYYIVNNNTIVDIFLNNYKKKLIVKSKSTRGLVLDYAINNYITLYMDESFSKEKSFSILIDENVENYLASKKDQKNPFDLYVSVKIEDFNTTITIDSSNEGRQIELLDSPLEYVANIKDRFVQSIESLFS